jgi:cellulose synthase/poly-beta-1,6-N-acetylglucosamine synthase-like glycosyltransferase
VHGRLDPGYLLATALLGGWLALWESRWFSLPLMARPVALAPSPGLRVAAVTTIVPSKEPLAMLEATVEALVAMRYPHDTWVLDEEGEPEVAAMCDRLGARYFTRTTTAAANAVDGRFAHHTKHGNYNVWLAAVGFEQYDVLVAFDLDHVPQRQYLLRTLGYFRDPTVGYVQVAPGFYNQADSLVARGGAEETYTYWSTTVAAAYGAGHVTVNGSHNVHRVKALEEAGGLADHDGDDYLLGLRYRAQGWRGVYVPEHLALGTSPTSWVSYLRQQRRWARSLLDIKLRELPSIIDGLPWGDRAAAALQGAFFLSGAAIPLIFGIIAIWLAGGSAPLPLETSWPYVLASLAAVSLCEAFRQRFAIDPAERGFHWRALFVRFAKWPYLVLAFVDALGGGRRSYELTEKQASSEVERLAPAAHLAAAVLVVSAWAAGVVSGGIDDMGLHLVAALLVAGSIAAAAATIRRTTVSTPVLAAAQPSRARPGAGDGPMTGVRPLVDPRSRRRRLAAKVVHIRLDEPLTPIEVEDRYGEVRLIVRGADRILGHVTLPAARVLPAEIQRSAIAAKLGEAIWREEFRDAFLDAAGQRRPKPVGSAGRLRISVVVCTRDRPEQLEECLQSLMALEPRPLEVIVVDNAPSDDRTRSTCEQYPVRYVVEPAPGLSRARNRGVVETRGDAVAFTDDDCVVDPSWLDGLDAAFSDPLVMAVTGYVGPVEMEHPAQFLFEASGGFNRGFHRALYDGLVDSPAGVAGLAGAGANMVVRRSGFEAVGLFAEDLGAGTPAAAAEETYLFYRLLATGHRILFDPGRIVWHRHRADHNALRRMLHGYSVGMMAFTVRCLVRHRDFAALKVPAWLFCKHFPEMLGRTVRRDDHRLPIRLLLAELAGSIAGVLSLARSRLARRRVPPIRLPDRAPLRAVAVVASETPTLTVVVPSYNRRAGLQNLLEGLSRQTYPSEAFETVVVLDGSRDGSADLVRSLDPPFRLRLVEQENAGAAAARNRGAAEARNDVLVFLDDDIAPDESFLAEHAAGHARGAELAIVGYCPPVVTSADLWSQAVRAWWEDHFRRKSEQSHQWTFIDFTVGNSSMPRRTFLDCGGLDRSFANRGREDWELAVRMLRAGTQLAYRPEAIGHHFVDTSYRTRLRQLRQEARDDVLFASKHPHVRGQLLLGALADELSGGSTARALHVYRHASASDAAVVAGIRLLGIYERLGMRNHWRRLTQNLMGVVYIRGVADMLGSPEQFLAFFAPTWAEEPARFELSLDRRSSAPAPAWAGPIELVLDAGGREAARLPAFARGGQWNWEESAERAFAVSWPIRQERMRTWVESLGEHGPGLSSREIARVR